MKTKSTGDAMTTKCLCLKLPDSREVFTHETNKIALKELSVTFGIKIMAVEAQEPVLLSVNEVVNYFCDHSQKTFLVNYTTDSKISTNEKGQRTNNVYDIRSHIESELVKGEVVRIKELHKQFSPHNIAVSTIYRHLNFVKNKLSKEGMKIVKVMVGCYKIGY
jgi:hypothetical protein